MTGINADRSIAVLSINGLHSPVKRQTIRLDPKTGSPLFGAAKKHIYAKGRHHLLVRCGMEPEKQWDQEIQRRDYSSIWQIDFKSMLWLQKLPFMQGIHLGTHQAFVSDSRPWKTNTQLPWLREPHPEMYSRDYLLVLIWITVFLTADTQGFFWVALIF